MQQIGRYQILGELGRGAMGVVYGAMDPAIGRHVAIKTIRLSEVSDPKEQARLRERLLREAQSAGKLFHPGIVVVLDVGQQGDLTYIAMEFVNGPSLDHLLSEGEPLPASKLIDILKQAAAALDYAHKKGIVHRDIKPANILIHEDGLVKITDFGVAKVSSAQSMTQTGTVLGTPNYMSPEQIQGKPVSGSSDQFSLGVIAYEMLTGEKPFAAEQMTTVLYRIVGEEPPAAQSLNPSIGWPASVVLAKALSKDPGSRFADCSEFVKALETALETKKDFKPVARGTVETLPTAVVVPVAAAPQSIRRREPPPKKRGFGWGLAFTALAAFALVGLVFVVAREWFAPSDRPAPQPQETAETDVPSNKPSPMGAPLSRPAAQETAQAAGTQPEQAPPPAAPPAAGSAEGPAGGEAPAPAPEAKQPEKQPEPKRTESAAPAPAPEPSQTVQVTTSPPGARVVFDNNPAVSCTSPCAMPLPSGRHTLAASLSGHRTELRIFQVSGQPREMFVNLTDTQGKVRVISNPPGARIFVNGQARSETTPAELTLPAGHYTIVVFRSGRRAEQDFDLKEGAAVRIDFALN